MCNPQNKLTNALVDKRLVDAKRTIKRLGDYINIDTKLEWQCITCGHKWEARVSSVLNDGAGCPKCASSAGKLTNETVDKRLLDAKRLIKRLDDYKGIDEAIEWLCLKNECGFIWSATPDSILGKKKQGCPLCRRPVSLKPRIKKSKSDDPNRKKRGSGGGFSFTNEMVDKRVLDKKYPIKRLGQYKDAHSHIEWLCLIPKCGHTWKATPNNIYLGKGCPKCGKIKNADGNRLDNESVDRRLLEGKRPVKRLGQYTKAINDLQWECLQCHFKWNASPHSVVNGGSGCPKCGMPGNNERLMHDILETSGVIYTPQYSIRNILKTVPRYLIDAFFPDVRIAVEYNGVQHYKPTRFSNTLDPEEDFRKQQARDQFVREFCAEYSIELIEIDGTKLKGHSLVNYIREELIPYIQSKQAQLDHC